MHPFIGLVLLDVVLSRGDRDVTATAVRRSRPLPPAPGVRRPRLPWWWRLAGLRRTV